MARGRRTAARDRPSIVQRLAQPQNLIAVLLLFWMSGPVAPFIPNLDNTFTTLYTMQPRNLAPPLDAGGDLLRLSWIPVYLVVIVAAMRHWRLVRRFMMRNRLLLLLLGWTMLSTLWSVSPPDTLRRSIALDLSTLLGIYLGMRFDVLWMLRLLAAALTVDMVASVICGLAFPDIGIANDGDYAGAWRGVFTSKNQLGAMMVLGCLVFYLLYLADRRRWHLLGFGVALALLALSTSRTPIAILLALAAGAGLTFVAEIADKGIRRSSDIFGIVDNKLIVSIPYIITSAEVRRRKRRMLRD